VALTWHQHDSQNSNGNLIPKHGNVLFTHGNNLFPIHICEPYMLSCGNVHGLHGNPLEMCVPCMGSHWKCAISIWEHAGKYGSNTSECDTNVIGSHQELDMDTC
jgi:hypothetical protein